MSNPILKSKLAPIAEAHNRSQLRRKQGIAWLTFAVLGIGWFLLDHQNGGFRWQVLVLILAAFLVWIFLRTRAQRIDIHALARRLEKEHPNLHALLITAVDVETDSKSGAFSYLQKRVIREALAKNAHDPWNQRGNERLFFTQSFHLISFTSFILVAIALFFSKPSTDRVSRFRGEVEVQPGNHTMERGTSLVITARFGKKIPAEAMLILLPSDGASRRIPLKRNLSDPVFGTSLMSVNADTKYHIEYGEVQTEDFHLTVFDYPALRQSDAELIYPDYTGLPHRLIKDTRRITALEGTALTYSFILNKAIEEGNLIGQDGKLIPLVPDPIRPNTYFAKMSLTKSDRYDLQLRDAEGRSNKLASDFVIRVKPNQLATLKLKSPLGNRRFSAVEEVRFEGELWDDYGLGAYGFGYAVGTDEPILVEYGKNAPAKKRLDIEHWMEIERFDIAPQSLISYYLWADDIGPDGKMRRNFSDMFFAEIRPFEEIFQENQSGGQSGSSPSMQLAEIQREILHAIWNIQRRESGELLSENFSEDVTILIESQSSAIVQAEQLAGELENAQSDQNVENDQNVQSDHSKLQLAIEAMNQTKDHLSIAVDSLSTKSFPDAIGTARSAYHYLLQIQPNRFQVSQNGGSGGGGRSQQQLNQLEMTDLENRYETQSQATAQRNDQENEQLQILNRLKELARRQQDLNQRLQELQTALDAADPKEREEIDRQLKRLRQEQREMLEDMDALRQRVADQNTPESSQALSDLDRIRSQAQQSAEALEDRQISRALASGTRTQQDLETLRDDYREQSSGQFSQAVQSLRAQADALAERQDQIEKDLQVADQRDRQSLAKTEEASNVMQNVARQKEDLQRLLDEIRRVSEDAETAEPLLSRQLHEAYRNTDIEQLKEQLEYTSQLARLNLIDKAQEFERQSHEAIDALKDRIDRAAQSVLGDGIESLRRARLVLDELVKDVENEIANNSPSSQTDPNFQNFQNDENDQNDQIVQNDRTDQIDQNIQNFQNDESDQNDENFRNNQIVQNDQNIRSDSNFQNFQNDENFQRDQNFRNDRGDRDGEGDQGNQGNSLRNAWNIGDGGDRSGSGGGPITGQDFSRFSDRLREVEEMIDVPDLQNEVAAVRDRARAMRIDFRRHGKAPQWDLVRMQVEKPLAEIRKQVGEELARRLSREAIVPIDRDPVPQRYSELVRRYYETLGEGK